MDILKNDILIEQFGDRHIAIKGIGKMFYQDGFPISISVSELGKHGIEVSILHVADECMKNGWSPKTTVNKLKADFEDDIDSNKIDIKLLEHFCMSNYEDQRDMLFNYLFKADRNFAADWLRNKISNS